jgi:NADPH:quinone reductase-like Zn-dependent oxidoreductase
MTPQPDTAALPVLVRDTVVADRTTPEAPLTAKNTMRALVQHQYGSPDVLNIEEVAKPAPDPDEVLVQVKAASVNARDWHVMRGEPRFARLMDRKTFGRSGPRVKIRGTDFAGVVEAVGAGVTGLRPGDAVFGEADAAIAEYVVAPQKFVAAMPAGLDFEQAAAMPLAANTALMCLRAGRPEAGQRLMINGASGGVGLFAVQLAKSMGLHVTAVCSTRNVEMASSLGADVVVDYRAEDVCTRRETYDIILDLVGNRSFRDLRRVLTPGGRLVLSGGGVSGEGRFLGPIAMLIRAPFAAKLLRIKIAIPEAKPSPKNLAELSGLAVSGTIHSVVEKAFPFESAADAIRHLESEHARAKVVITVAHPAA